MAPNLNGNGYETDHLALLPESPPPFPVWKQVLLWIAVLPGALLGSTVVYWLAHIVTWLGSSYTGDEDTWLHHIWSEVIRNGVCGAAWVYCAGYIAPRAKITVAITFAAALLFLSSLSFFNAIAQHEWMSLLGVVFLNAGAILCAVSVATRETTF